jgi:hypothetical protein
LGGVTVSCDRGAHGGVVKHAGWRQALSDFLGDTEPSDDDRDDWIIRDIVPRGEPWLLAGTWKVGKTWVMLSLACQIAVGRDWAGCANTLARPAKVLVVALEDGRRRIQKRLWQLIRGMCLTADELATLRSNLSISSSPLSLPGDECAFATYLEGDRDQVPEVVIIDSLSRVMRGNQNSTEDAGAFTKAWATIARDTRAAVGFIHHTNKIGADYAGDPMNTIRGSGELQAFPRNLVLVQRDDDARKLGRFQSTVAVRGNLDVTRDSFAIELVTEESDDGRMAVRFVDRGSPATSDERRAAKAETNKREKQAATEDELRRCLNAAVCGERLTGARIGKILGFAEQTGGKRRTAWGEAGWIDENGNITDAGRVLLSSLVPYNPPSGGAASEAR